jgi:Ca2+/Na+ antiporter
MCKNNTLLLFTLICIVIGSFALLTPFSVIDNDGLLDSFCTDDFFLLPVLLTVTGLFFLLTKLPSTCFTVPQPFSTLLVPPPISN